MDIKLNSLFFIIFAPVSPDVKESINKTKEATSTTTTTAPCLNYEFRCTKSQKCIHNNWICDGEADCPHSEDESDETCLANKCADGQFRCHIGNCIDTRLKCDGVKHCIDNSDELDCSE